MPRSAALLLTLLAGLLAAAPAQAAERFLGVLADGRAARFTSQAPTALTTPRPIAGLARGDRVVALGAGHALGRSGRLYRLDTRALRATPTGARLDLQGASFSLLVDAAGSRARVLSDAGQDVLVDLAAGTTAPGPGLRTAAGQVVRPAAALLPDGRIAGVDTSRATLVTETAPGSNVVTETPLRNPREARLRLPGPNAFALAGGAGYLVSGFPPQQRPQSRFLPVDLATGDVTGESGPYFFRELRAVLPLGTVADDRRGPRLRIVGAPRRVSLRALARRGGFRLRVRCSEGCFVFASSAVGGRSNAAATRTTDVARTFTVRLPRLAGREVRLMRLRVGRTAFFRVRGQDWAGNTAATARRFRVVR